MAKKHQGRCACGAVTFEFDTDPDFVAVCHCLDCKGASGGEAATWFGIPADDFALLSGNPTAYRYTADSGQPLDRNFCPTCGSRLYTSNLGSFPGMVFVQIGSLTDATGIRPGLEMFVKRRLDWVEPLHMPQFSDMPG
ncbi:MAG: GFA family protein [Sphingobium sp.]|nr:GFA family protein [Sphingobium sp.]